LCSCPSKWGEIYYEIVGEVGDWTWRVMGIEHDWCRFA